MAKWLGLGGLFFLVFALSKCVNPIYERVFEPNYFGGQDTGVSLSVFESVTITDRYFLDPVEIGEPFNFALQMLDEGIGRQELGQVEIRFLDQFGAPLSTITWQMSPSQETVGRQTLPFPRELIYLENIELPVNPHRIEILMWTCLGPQTCEPIRREFEMSIVERQYLGSQIWTTLMSI